MTVQRFSRIAFRSCVVVLGALGVLVLTVVVLSSAIILAILFGDTIVICLAYLVAIAIIAGELYMLYYCSPLQWIREQ